jgi:hypothetical protein
MLEYTRTKSTDLKGLGESPAHQEQDGVVEEAGGGQEQEIDSDRISEYQPRRRRLGAFQVDWLDGRN